MFDTLETDIVVMQETKIQRKDLGDDMVLVPGWDVFFSLPKYKKGMTLVVVANASLNGIQATRALPSTPGTLSAVQSVPRKVSPASFARQAPQPVSEISLPSSRLEVIPSRANCQAALTKRVSTRKGAV
jgi:hypothetical protein